MRQSEIKKTRIGQGSTSPLRLQLLTSLISSRGSSNSNNTSRKINLLLLLMLPLIILLQAKGAKGQAAISVAALGSNDTSSAVEITGVCNDLLPNCTQRGINGECDSDPADMLVNCPSTCGSCLPVSEADCVDKGDPDSCFLGAALGECTANPSYYLRFCSASCSEFLPICSLQTRDFGEACREQSRSLTNPDFDCGTDFVEGSQREARSVPVFFIPDYRGDQDRNLTTTQHSKLEMRALRKSMMEKIDNNLQKQWRNRRTSANMRRKSVNKVKFDKGRNRKHAPRKYKRKNRRKNRKKGKQHKMKRGNKKKKMKIPSFMTAIDTMNLETSINKVTKHTTTQEIHKLVSLKTQSSLISPLYKEHLSADNRQQKTSVFVKQDAPANVPVSTNIIVETLPAQTITSTVAINTVTMTVEGSVATVSTFTSIIPLSSTTYTLSSSFETVTICTEDFTIPQSYLSLLSGFGSISTIIYQTMHSLTLLSSYIVTETIKEADLAFSTDLVSAVLLQRALLSTPKPEARNFISPTAMLTSPVFQFLPTSLPEKEINDIPLIGTRNEIHNVQITEPEWRITITSTVIVAHTIYTKCETPAPEDKQCSVNTKDDDSCEIMPSEEGYCTLPCDQNCTKAVIKRDHCNTNYEICSDTIIDLDRCGGKSEGKCPNLTIVIDNCENDILNDCQSLILGVGNNTDTEAACPIPIIDFSNCEGTNSENCSEINILSSSHAKELLFSQENCFRMYLDDDDSCEALTTDKVKCLNIVFEESSCPSISDKDGGCTVIVSKKNSLLYIAPVTCESPPLTTPTTSNPTTSETSLTTPTTEPTTPNLTLTSTNHPSPSTDTTSETPDPTTTPTDPSTSPTDYSTDSTTNVPTTETNSPSTPTNSTAPPDTTIDPPTTIIPTSTDPPVTTLPPTTISPDESTQPEEELLTPETIAALAIASTMISIIMSQTNISLFQQLLQQLLQAILQQLLQADQNSMNTQNNSDNNNNDNNQDDNTNNNDNNNNENNNDNSNNNDDSNNSANNNGQGNNQGSGQNGQGGPGSQDAQQTSPGGGGSAPQSPSSDNAAAALVPNCDAGGYILLVDELGSLVGKNTGKSLPSAVFDVVEAVNFCQHGGSDAIPSRAEDILMPDAELVPPPEWLGLSSPINIASRNKRRTKVEQQHTHRHQNTPIPSRVSSLFKPPAIEYGGWIPVTRYPYKQSAQMRKKIVQQNKGKSNPPNKLVRPKRKQGGFNSQSKDTVLIIANGLYTPPPEFSSMKGFKSSVSKVSPETFTKDQPAPPTSSSIPSMTEVIHPSVSTTSQDPSSTELSFSQIYVPLDITSEMFLTSQVPDMIDSTEHSLDLDDQSITTTVSSTTSSDNTTFSAINMTIDDPLQGLGPAAIGFAPDVDLEEDMDVENERREEHMDEEESAEDEGNDEAELTRNIFYCGGTLISQKHILTAAHCVIPRKPNLIRLGERDFSTSNESRTVDYRVKRIAVNPGYRFPVKYNDIAVITLEEDIPLNSGLIPSCVPQTELTLFEGQVATVSGWGTRANNEASDILIDVEVKVRSLLQCNESYNTLGEVFTLHYPEGLISNMLCAGGDDGQDVCRGDSGGPLFLQEILQVAGVVSAGYGCGDVNFPGLYTRVDSFLAWIDLAVYGRCASPIR